MDDLSLLGMVDELALEDAPQIFDRTVTATVTVESSQEPYISFVTGPNPMKRLIINIWSKEKGPTGEPHADGNPYTWFSLGLIQSDPSQMIDPEDLYEIQSNSNTSGEVQCHTLQWHLGTPTEDEGDELQGWIESMACTSGLKIGVFPFASKGGYANIVHRIEVQIYDKSLEAATPSCEDQSLTTMSGNGDAGMHVSAQVPSSDGDDLFEYLNGLDSAVAADQAAETSDIVKETRALKVALQTNPEDVDTLLEILFNLFSRFQGRFSVSKSLDDLNRMIEALDRITKITPENHPRFSLCWSCLGTYLCLRWEMTHVNADLDDAVESKAKALRVPPKINILYAYCLSEYAKVLFERSRIQKTRSAGDTNLGIAIETAVQAATLTPRVHPEYLRRQKQVCDLLGYRFMLGDSVSDLDRSIEAGQKIVEAARPGAVLWIRGLENLGSAFSWRYKRIHRLEDLDQAIVYARKAVQGAFYTFPNRLYPEAASYIRKLVSHLSMEFGRTGSAGSLTEALDLALKVPEMRLSTPQLDNAIMDAALLVKETDPTQKHYPELLDGLGYTLGSRYYQTKSSVDLDLKIEVSARAAHTTPIENAEFMERLFELGRGFLLRGGKTWANNSWDDDLDRAMRIFKIVVATTPEDSAQLLERRQGLSILLHRCIREGKGSEKERSLLREQSEQATKMEHSNDPNNIKLKVGIWESTFFVFRKQSQRTKSVTDLSGAIDACTQLLKVTDQDSLERFKRLDALGSLLGMRSDQTGSLEDLSQGIEMFTQAVKMPSACQDEPAMCLGNLAQSLTRRHQIIGARSDIDRALESAREAKVLLDREHYLFPWLLNVLGGAQSALYTRTQLMEHLEYSVGAYRDAVTSERRQSSPDFYGLSVYSHNLALWLLELSKRKDSRDVLDEAVKAAQEAVDLLPKLQSADGSYLMTLAHCYEEKFKRSDSMEDLDQAIRIASDAADRFGEGHTMSAVCLCNLGVFYEIRFRKTDSKTDQSQVFDLLMRSWNCVNSPARERLIAAKNIIEEYGLRSQWAEAAELSQNALALINSNSPRYLDHSDTQHLSQNASGLASKGAAAAISAGQHPATALALLELGRGITASFSMDKQEEYSDLGLLEPEKATKLKILKERLRSPLPSGLSLEDQLTWSQQRHDADLEFNDLLEEIRSIEGLEGYLLPLGEDQFREVAAKGPIIVINLCEWRSDAFLVSEDNGVQLLELPGLESQDFSVRMRAATDARAGSTLRWLWDTVCRPCLDELGFDKPRSTDWPRVTWVPTNGLNMMPLHAAGNYDSDTGETVMDRVISSYALSIKSLHHSRTRRDAPSSDKTGPATAVLVGMPTTPNQSYLSGAEKEVVSVEKICPLLHLNSVTLLACNKEDVLDRLKHCRIFHFAGHGATDKDPSRSSLLLRDWQTNPLTVADIWEIGLQKDPPFLAYLSACSTSTSLDWRLRDEGISLIGAFQLSGFRHALGTLWPIEDAPSVQIAEVVYRTLAEKGQTDETVSLALHLALRELRDGSTIEKTVQKSHDRSQREVDGEREEGGQTVKPTGNRLKNTHWIPYVHFGA